MSSTVNIDPARWTPLRIRHHDNPRNMTDMNHRVRLNAYQQCDCNGKNTNDSKQFNQVTQLHSRGDRSKSNEMEGQSYETPCLWAMRDQFMITKWLVHYGLNHSARMVVSQALVLLDLHTDFNDDFGGYA
ncbi:hypothetical protein D915_001270 [Fasciola hepatica]|uniref:Uncharacterized protein n=1 Tax=Fasciola hepatica TaxID=6192 RepID=A0A4E0RQ88_FASHE|nr:hypothetical protein D915_001270 [Fasciola hepatica]